MALSDPTTDVPTPTGTLQGVAAFNWDGSAWQPSGRAGPSVATPTGVLRGVAAFNGGPVWQPAGLAQPGVTTPTGTLDGVAVYTWSGDSWAPPGGQPTPSTPSGALRGVAAFNWDGAAWQPAAQAGPSVATPYGALEGVAMFGWTGSAWAAVGAPSLSLDFTSGPLDPRITFTRASTATYFDVNGTMQTAATNAPRFDYDPVTHVARGLLIEEARTNALASSADFTNGSFWSTAGYNGPIAPVVTANQVIAPDGTMSGNRIVYPAVSGASAGSQVANSFTATANAYAGSMWLRGSVGGEQLYLLVENGSGTYYRTLATLTTSWQLFSVVTPALTAGTWYVVIGVDLRDGGQSSKPAQTVYAWGAQCEQGGFPTSYIPTTVAQATRAVDVASMPAAGWYNASASSMAVDAIYQPITGSTQTAICLDDGTTTNYARFYRTTADANLYAQLGGGTSYNVALGTFSGGAVIKAAMAWQAAAQSAALNGVMGAGATGALIPTGITTLRMGALAGSIQMLCGWVRRVRYWPRVLSNAELQAVTT